jgi:hypothetical protein
MEPKSKKEWREKMFENWMSTRQDAPNEVTHDVVTLLGLLAVLRGEPRDIQNTAGAVLVKTVGEGSTDPSVNRTKHPLLNCWRNALAHPGLIDFEPEDGALAHREIEIVVLRDADGEHAPHHWELKIPVQQLPTLIEALARV